MAAKTNCPICGKLADPKLEHCPHCGGPITQSALSPGASSSDVQRANKCPHCGSAVQDGDIICVACGTNLLTGEKIAEEQAPVVAKAPRNWRPVLIAAGVVVALVALAGGAVLLFAEDPVAQAVRLSREGDVYGGINVLQEYVDTHGGEKEAQLVLGKLQWQGQQYPQASRSFDAASLLDPDDEEAGLLAVIAAGDVKGPEGRSLQFEALQRVVGPHPENGTARYLFGLALAARKDYAGAIRELQQVVSASPANARAKRALGVVQALNEDYPEAAKTLESALLLEENADTLAAQGLVAHLEGRLDDAAGKLEQALEQEASIDAFARARLGLIHMSRGEYEKALPYLGEAKDAPNALPAVDYFYALCLGDNGLVPEALAQYERVTAAGGRYAAAAATQMALLHMQQNDVKRARDAARQAIQLGGPAAKLETIQGRLHLMEGNRNEARQAFRNAIQANPRYAPAHLEMGLSYLADGVHSEGLRELDRYLELVGPQQAGAAASTDDPVVATLREFVAQLRASVEK